MFVRILFVLVVMMTIRPASLHDSTQIPLIEFFVFEVKDAAYLWNGEEGE